MSRTPLRGRRARTLARSVCVAALASLFLAGPARAGLNLSTQQTIDAPATAAASLDQVTPAIAYGAGMYFAVWRDGNFQVGQVWTIRGVRMHPDGSFIDDQPIVVRSSGEDLLRPSVGFDGTNFLVAWERAASNGNSDVFAAYVAPATGVAGDAFQIIDASDPNNAYPQTQPVVSGGDGYALVTYNEFATLYTAEDEETLWGALFGQTGQIGSNFQISPQNEPGFSSSSAWSHDAQMFLVAWHDSENGGNIFASQVDVTGSPTTPFPVSQTPSATEDLNVAVLDSDFMVGWSELEPGAPNAIHARAVPPTGTPGTDEFEVATAPASDIYLERPQLLGVDGQFFGIWEGLYVDGDFAGYSSLYGGRFSAAGAITDGATGVQFVAGQPGIAPVLPSVDTSPRTAVASSGTTGIAVFDRADTGIATASDVLFVTLDPTTPTLANQAPSPLATQPSLEQTWSVATNGSMFLLVWEDDRDVVGSNGGLDIYGLRIALDGTPIDTAPFLISLSTLTPGAPAEGDQFHAVAAGIPGGDFLVVWNDGRGLAVGDGLDLYGATIGATGGPMTQLRVSTAPEEQDDAAIAASPDGWLVAWEDYSPTDTVGGRASAVFSAFVPASATGSDTFAAHQLTLASPIAPTACQPAVAWNGSHFFVAYEQPCSADYLQGNGDVFGQWHAPDGTFIGGAVTIADLVQSETQPALATEDGRTFVAWREQSEQDAILTTTFSDLATTSEQAATTIYTAAGVREAPALAAVGGTLLVSWIDDQPFQVSAVRRQADAGLEVIDQAPLVVYSGTVYQGPDVLAENPQDESGEFDSVTPRFTPAPALVAASTGQALISVNVLEPIVGRTVARANFWQLGLAGNGAACTVAQECGDGLCTNGTCCDVSCDGVCQSCGQHGCVATPATDTRCPTSSTTSCAEFSTTCRTYAAGSTPAGQCIAFGECASPTAAGECTQFTDAADGTSCSAPGCTVGASCQGGACMCSADQNALSPARSVGCDTTPGRRSTGATSLWVGLFVLALALERRRAARA